MLSAISKTIAPGFYCRNESEIPILFVLSQLSPLHWIVVQPGESKHIKCGRVFFTASIDPYIEGEEPTTASVAGRIGVVIAVAIVSPVLGFIPLGLVGALTGITSVRGVKKDGVLADGRIAVIKGRIISNKKTYELFFDHIEKQDHESLV